MVITQTVTSTRTRKNKWFDANLLYIFVDFQTRLFDSWIDWIGTEGNQLVGTKKWTLNRSVTSVWCCVRVYRDSFAALYRILFSFYRSDWSGLFDGERRTLEPNFVMEQSHERCRTPDARSASLFFYTFLVSAIQSKDILPSSSKEEKKTTNKNKKHVKRGK